MKSPVVLCLVLLIAVAAAIVIGSCGCGDSNPSGTVVVHRVVQFRVDGDCDSASVAASVGGFFVHGTFALPWRQTVEMVSGAPAILSAEHQFAVLFVEIVSDDRIVASIGGGDRVRAEGRI